MNIGALGCSANRHDWPVTDDRLVETIHGTSDLGRALSGENEEVTTEGICVSARLVDGVIGVWV